MCPVHDAAFGVPFVFPGKFNRVAFFQVFDSWSNVDIVSDENGLSRWQAQDEPLMAAATGVVREDMNHRSRSRDMDIAEVLFVGIFCRLDVCPGGLREDGDAETGNPVDANNNREGDQYSLFHFS